MNGLAYFILGMLFAGIGYPILSVLVNTLEAFGEYISAIFAGKIAKIQNDIAESVSSNEPHSTSVIGFQIDDSPEDEGQMY